MRIESDQMGERRKITAGFINPFAFISVWRLEAKPHHQLYLTSHIPVLIMLRVGDGKKGATYYPIKQCKKKND